MKKFLTLLVLSFVLISCDDGWEPLCEDECCKCCDPDVSKPCGDSSISKNYTCHQSSGCAFYEY